MARKKNTLLSRFRTKKEAEEEGIKANLGKNLEVETMPEIDDGEVEEEEELVTPDMVDEDEEEYSEEEIEVEADTEEDTGEQELSSEYEGQLTIDVFQTPKHIVIVSTIAGVDPQAIDVSIDNDMVTVKGERKNEIEVNEEDYYYQECYWGSFSRSVILPVDVLADKAEASLKNGILTVKLPKAKTSKTKKINVKAA
jgi:HSP20 family protein